MVAKLVDQGLRSSIYLHSVSYTPDKKRRQNVQNPCLAFYMEVSMWEPLIFLLQCMEKKLCK